MSDPIVRPVTDAEYPAFVEAVFDGFSGDLPESEGFIDRERIIMPPERTLAAFDGETIVGTFGGFDFVVAVPGGLMKMDGTTVVTVQPTHRRQGILRSMMASYLDTAAEAGYPIAGLWASETNIYGRFGYGIATYRHALSLRSQGIEFRDRVPVDRVRRLGQGEAAKVLPDVYARSSEVTPGMIQRPPVWWENFVLPDEAWMRKGKTARRFVVHDGDHGVDGYASYRLASGSSDDGHDDATVHVVELVASTARAEASLWAYLTRIDGAPNVEAWNVPIDSPLPMMVTEPRRIRVKSVGDSLWIRILDVQTALTGRTYEVDGSVSFRVVDPFRPATEGSYQLDVSSGSASCILVDDADIEIDVDALGALLLGGGDGIAYGAAGRIRGPRASIEALHTMFRTVSAPWVDTVF